MMTTVIEGGDPSGRYLFGSHCPFATLPIVYRLVTR